MWLNINYMGCDIHFFTEKWSDEDFEGPRDISEERNIKLESVLDDKKTYRWISADKWEIRYPGTEDEYWSVHRDHEFYDNRNYYLYSILADVRNYGLDRIKPICEPRGVPEDASSSYKYMVDRWNGDGHSHSYFTLTELLEIDWSKYNTEWIQDFIEAIEKMKQIDSNSDNVRACFFFDN